MKHLSRRNPSSEDDRFQLSPAAEDKGMLFIPGCGATPGITNVMAQRGIKIYERVEEYGLVVKG